MNKNNALILVFLSLLLYSCNQIDKEDFSGEWIVNKATFKNVDISFPTTKSIKLSVMPLGYGNKNTITFNLKDSTVSFPGINTEDIPCKWKIGDKKLTIYFDTVGFENDALLSIDTIKTASILNHDSILKTIYDFKRDSILKIKNTNTLKVPLQAYVGVYNIEKVNHGLILTSSTTRLELLNLDYIFKRAIDNMFLNVRPQH